ncbi:Transcription initiation factor TFIID subunit 7 [Eumeta japonica]|uniref:Transcription initiation factor TFIID subunit 7 n=1 Tax=Eumeta variegata TaxID=151549 RepID=A0A4C1U8T9_EUMVA|nr:Transcription initiation factor TFIID subunit 7 [Eumeta japonica]
MNKERRDFDYPVELESQFVLRLPEEPSKVLRELLQSGDSLKNRLAIQIDNDMRHGEVRFDHWLMHAKIVDLPTIVESLKTIDNKSFYKTADICQMMICKEEPDQPSVEEETPIKNKKKDPYKVDKKFLWPHGITPPTKNVRKRRFRKTLKKKYVEAPEIEKELKRLLRVDHEADSFTWEVIKEEEEPISKTETPVSTNSKPEKSKVKPERNVKMETLLDTTNAESSNVVDIFGEAVSDSDLDDDNINVDMEDSHFSAYDSRLSDSNSMHGTGDSKDGRLPTQFRPDMFRSSHSKYGGIDSQGALTSASHSRSVTPASQSMISKSGGLSSEEDSEYQPTTITKESITLGMEQLSAELEELEQRRQRTQHEISGMENLALKQRFQETLQNIIQEIMYKKMKYQDLQNLQQQTDDM